MDALLEAVHASAPAAAGVPSTADGSQAAPPAAAPAAAGKRRGAGAQPASKRASKPARGERGGGKAGGSSRRPARPPTREQLLAQLVTRLRNASRRKRKDTAWRRSPAFELLQEQKAQEAKRKAELEQAAAAAVAQQQPLIKPPSWWHALWADSPARREQSSLRVDLSDQGDDNPLVSAVEARSSHDGSVFQLRLEPRSMTHLDLHWCFPPANPGSSGAWIGLFAAHEGVHEPRARLRFKLLTRDAVCGTLKWTSKQFAGLPDGEYVFALMADYGVESRALSQRFWLLDSRCVMLDGEPGAVALSESLGPRGRNSRFALTTRKAGADDEEALDERCYFPVPLVDVVLGREAEAAPPPPSGALAAEAAASEPAPAPAAGTGTYSSRVKRAYQLTDKHSYLDWGLSSDYDRSALADERRVAAAGRAGGAGGAAAAAAAEGGVYVPAQLARVMRKPAKQTGLGGGTRGSEGYGEATIGSVQKLLVVLQHLRHLVLTRLYSDAPWNSLYDLTPLSTFIDIGSGYGKVVVHAKLEAHAKRCVGIECVSSRHEIACKVLGTLREDLSRASLEMAAAKYSDAAIAPAERASHAHGGAVAAPAAATVGAASALAAGESGGGTAPADGAPASGPELMDTEPEPGSSGSTSPATVLAAEEAASRAAKLEAWGFPPCIDLGRLAQPLVKEPDEYRGVEFIYDDATTAFGDVLPFTHVYIFDRVFSHVTLSALAQLLSRSPFLVLVSFRPCREWWRHGLVKVQPVAKVKCSTTGQEGCNAYVYINMERAPGMGA